MVIDSSAVIAILLDEPPRRKLNEALERAESRVMSAAAFLEASIVMESSFGADGVRDLDHLISEAGIEIIDFDARQALAARRAFRRFGKGRHPARLNYGDCFAYALAETRGERLLFVGDDFARAGLESL